MKRHAQNNDWLRLFRSSTFMLRVGLLADQYNTELDGVKKSSSGSNELLRESLLVELVEGASWQSYTNSLLWFFCSLFCPSYSFTFPCLLLTGSFWSVVLHLLSPFSSSVNLPLWMGNVVLIRHFAKPVCLGQTLSKAPHICSELVFKPSL